MMTWRPNTTTCGHRLLTPKTPLSTTHLSSKPKLSFQTWTSPGRRSRRQSLTSRHSSKEETQELAPKMKPPLLLPPPLPQLPREQNSRPRSRPLRLSKAHTQLLPQKKSRLWTNKSQLPSVRKRSSRERCNSKRRTNSELKPLKPEERALNRWTTN